MMGYRLFLLFCCVMSIAHASDPLPSWNDSQSKQAIMKFVQEVTQESHPDFIPVDDRIATFDEDGTLWVEQPLYTEFFYVIDTIRRDASNHPEWQHEEPFKTVLSGDLAKMQNFSKQEIALMLAATHAGMDVETFRKSVAEWIKTHNHPRFNRPFAELIYQPMLEAMQFLHDNGFKIYIVSGGGQEFIRAFAKKVYNLSPEYIIGTAAKVRYEYTADGRPVLTKLSQLLFVNDKEGKPEGINLIIGKRPVIAFGNSIGDQQMLEWTQSTPRKTAEFLVQHDDADREYAYGPDSKIGTFSNELKEEANHRRWNVISMKNDWKVIFPWQIRASSKN